MGRAADFSVAGGNSYARITRPPGAVAGRRGRHIGLRHHFVLAGGVAADRIGRAATSQQFRHGYRTPRSRCTSG
jgi:hypothetical protein